MDGLNYHHLLYFWTVARTGSIANAGIELGLTQPTISEQLRLLEKSLGHTLFERRGRSLILTEKGSTVLQYAEKIFALGEELTGAMSDPRPSAPQKLRVAVGPEISAVMLAQALRPLAKLEPKPAVSVIAEPGERAMAKLRDGKLDVVFSSNPGLVKTSAGAHRHLLRECDTVFAATRGPAGRFPKSLHDRALLLPAEPLRSQLLRWMKGQRVETRAAGEIESPDLAVSMAENGLGVVVLPDLPGLVSAKLKVLGRTGAVRWPLYAFTAEKQPRNAALAKVVIRSAK